jgi:hypothetical protein
MIKTYRIIPLVFILFLFGFTLITASPVFAQGKWDKSMGMRHPDRPCMDRAKHPGGCGPDRRSPAQIASDPFDTNNPVSLAAKANTADGPTGDEVDQLNARIAELQNIVDILRQCRTAYNQCQSNTIVPRGYLTRMRMIEKIPEDLGRLKAQKQHGGTYDKPCGDGVCRKGQKYRLWFDELSNTCRGRARDGKC